MKINSYIEEAQLSLTASKEDIKKLCEEAKKHRYHAVCVNSSNVPLSKYYLITSNVKTVATVGFPLGAMSTEAKVYEAVKAVEDGAHEIDMVMNVGLMRSKNFVSVFKDIRDVKLAIGHIPLTVILEISELSKNEIIRACQICIDAKAEGIKTSTGFSKSGATLTAVKMIKKTVRNKIKIKASGGIDDYDMAIKYIDTGVVRIATTNGNQIITGQPSYALTN
ncbi:deoxyribose-phosphate aldolase [Mangrovimonas sp. AS39]|uniref:deoxyribose-phosphate aldolase n=1 Tax=Mangrovimonas futianensis TaxID=2895523 RepID=UPI001E4CD6DF|nr:deoxyribose-phosphate aldolase [Mangrovimonas futianensis]MCF1192660.1 deoxyribose-phosphate aldolase [Mangrovimonas futianensis]MCF1196419.1 deoxyribose-phosphate aldolase [Mangrovimonas futianensis]